jgi:hypothetical protein
MDSILIFNIDRIYRINWIFYMPGFRMKPVIGNPLRGKLINELKAMFHCTISR